MIIVKIAIYICIGLFAGFTSGMFGIGGGTVRIPLLNLAERIKPTNKNVFSFSFFVSFITGLRGGSGGQIFPALFKSLGLNTHKAIATSLTVSIFTAFGVIKKVRWKK